MDILGNLNINSGDLNIGSGGTLTIEASTGLTMNGPISATTVSATTFYGDGSNLTSIASQANLVAHTGDTNNPHSVTLTQLSGVTESLFNVHTGDTNNPHQVTLTQLSGVTESLFNVHTGDTNNPHSVTLSQLSGVTESLFNVHTGDTNNPHSVTLSQLSGVVDTLFNAHTGDTNNPHQVTLTQLSGVTESLFNVHTGDTATHFTKSSLDSVFISVTGDTMTGTLVGTTISATTFFGDGSNLTGMAVDTNTYSTGATFTNNILEITNSTGGTLDTTIDTFTGVTINGDLTISGVTTGVTNDLIGILSNGTFIKNPALTKADDDTDAGLSGVTTGQFYQLSGNDVGPFSGLTGVVMVKQP